MANFSSNSTTSSAIVRARPLASARSISIRSACTLYDAVTTRVFPRLERDRMALKLSAKNDRLHRSDFRTLANTAGLKAAEADKAIDDMAAALAKSLDQIVLPALVPPGSAGAAAAARMREIIRGRLESFS